MKPGVWGLVIEQLACCLVGVEQKDSGAEASQGLAEAATGVGVGVGRAMGMGCRATGRHSTSARESRVCSFGALSRLCINYRSHGSNKGIRKKRVQWMDYAARRANLSSLWMPMNEHRLHHPLSAPFIIHLQHSNPTCAG